MPIPTQADQELAELDEIHSVILARCRSLMHTPGIDPAGIRELLQRYVDHAVELINARV